MTDRRQRTTLVRRGALGLTIVLAIVFAEAWLVLLAERGQAHDRYPFGSNIRSFGAALAWVVQSVTQLPVGKYEATSGAASAVSTVDVVAALLAFVVGATYLAQRRRSGTQQS